MPTPELATTVQALWERAEQLLGAAKLDEADAAAEELAHLLRDAPTADVPRDPDYGAALGLLGYTEVRARLPGRSR